MTSTVVAEGLRRTYGDLVALDDVSLSVEAGEVLALLGPNGAGKTTLVRALTGTTEPDAGSVELFGASPRAVAADRVGVLPQQFTPPERLTARELLTYYAGLYESARDVDRVLAEVGMADDADRWYEDLSGGQQRRVCLGITLVNDPDLLVLDEPTTGIDPAGRRTVRELVADLADAGTTVLVTTHDMDEAERLADRVALLVDGRVRARGSPAELVAAHGGDRRLVVSCEDGETPAASAVSALGDRVEVGDGEVRVYGVEASDVSRVAEAVAAAGATADELSWARPGLEDVYLAVTGETYERTGGEAGERASAESAGTEVGR
jgi:ABC-2 type transport system ATP-binding protein